MAASFSLFLRRRWCYCCVSMSCVLSCLLSSVSFSAAIFLFGLIYCQFTFTLLLFLTIFRYFGFLLYCLHELQCFLFFFLSSFFYKLLKFCSIHLFESNLLKKKKKTFLFRPLFFLWSTLIIFYCWHQMIRLIFLSSALDFILSRWRFFSFIFFIPI